MHTQHPGWNSQIFSLVFTMIRKKVYSLFFTKAVICTTCLRESIWTTSWPKDWYRYFMNMKQHWSRLPTTFDTIFAQYIVYPWIVTFYAKPAFLLYAAYQPLSEVGHIHLFIINDKNKEWTVFKYLLPTQVIKHKNCIQMGWSMAISTCTCT